MTTHRKRTVLLGPGDSADLLDALGQCRTVAVRAISALEPRAPIAREARHLLDDIDALACLITGDRAYFHAPGHSTRARPDGGRRE